jgi:D-alanine--D-alanine ligase
MKIGVFFGGVSREREVSFAGAKTVIDCINRLYFEPVLIFIDGKGRFIKLNAQQLAHERLIDFYPPEELIPEKLKIFSPLYAEMLPETDEVSFKAHIESVGTPIYAEHLSREIDFALLALHGTFAEDGTLQGLLEWLNIPYSGCGIFSSALSIDKHLQKKFADLLYPQTQRPYQILKRQDWLTQKRSILAQDIIKNVGLPLVVKAPFQGSSIGVSILKSDDLAAFIAAVNSAFFIKEVEQPQWVGLSTPEKFVWAKSLLALDREIGYPLIAIEQSGLNTQQTLCRNPLELVEKLDSYFSYSTKSLLLSSLESEEIVLFESFIEGKEFSCGVVQAPDGKGFALPPTEIIPLKAGAFYDYEAKYQVGASRKEIPIQVAEHDIERIQEHCKTWFETFQLEGYARIDGFFDKQGNIHLIDINTLPGMSPTSLIFRQAAEVGFSPTDFLTYIIWQSLRARAFSSKRPYQTSLHLANLTHKINHNQVEKPSLIVLHEQLSDTDLEAARKLYNRQAAEGKSPQLLWQNVQELLHLPIGFLLKPSMQELKNSVYQPLHPLLLRTAEKAQDLRTPIVPNFVPTPEPTSIEALFTTFRTIYLPQKPNAHLDTLRKNLTLLGFEVLDYA